MRSAQVYPQNDHSALYEADTMVDPRHRPGQRGRFDPRARHHRMITFAVIILVIVVVLATVLNLSLKRTKPSCTAPCDVTTTAASISTTTIRTPSDIANTEITTTITRTTAVVITETDESNTTAISNLISNPPQNWSDISFTDSSRQSDMAPNDAENGNTSATDRNKIEQETPTTGNQNIDLTAITMQIPLNATPSSRVF